MKWIFPFILFLTSCTGGSQEEKEPYFPSGEYDEAPLLTFLKEEALLPQVTLSPPPAYPWSGDFIGNFPKITMWDFQCRGKATHAPRVTTDSQGNKAVFFDCNGTLEHGLPLSGGKPYIYPVLIELLNLIQEKTGHKVVITCGHRCPTHNIWCDDTGALRHSKHMMGAEVDFYVEGMEDSPQEIVNLVMESYRQNYPEDEELTTFHRYRKDDTNVSTLPWYNKEIFIKLFKKDEGRDFENSHPYPYISFQVRYNKETGDRVIFNYDKAYDGYLKVR